MRAIQVREFGGPEVLKLEEVPDLKPGAGQVLVRLEAAGVNPVEAYIRTGTYAQKPVLPYTPGADGAGVVAALGQGVRGIKVNSRVYVEAALTGTYAQACLVQAHHVHPLPSFVTCAQGAAMGVPYGTAHRALFGKAKAKKGETLLVHGASGGVGTASVQLAVRAGLKVIGTAGSGEGLALVREQGAVLALDHKDPDYLKQLMAFTRGQGVDIVLEMAAHLNLGKDLTLLAKYGRVVVIGSRGPVEVNPRDSMGREASIHGMTLFNVTPEERVKIHKDLVQGLKTKKLRPVIGKELPLSAAAQAHELLMKPGAFGKTVLVP
ncbi:MAG TPA: NADPH:quinone reductase [bacterium]|nr:NADPH:quinone reductase [bacterium]